MTYLWTVLVFIFQGVKCNAADCIDFVTSSNVKYSSRDIKTIKLNDKSQGFLKKTLQWTFKQKCGFLNKEVWFSRIPDKSFSQAQARCEEECRKIQKCKAFTIDKRRKVFQHYRQFIGDRYIIYHIFQCK